MQLPISDQTFPCVGDRIAWTTPNPVLESTFTVAFQSVTFTIRQTNDESRRTPRAKPSALPPAARSSRFHQLHRLRPSVIGRGNHRGRSRDANPVQRKRLRRTTEVILRTVLVSLRGNGGAHAGSPFVRGDPGQPKPPKTTTGKQLQRPNATCEPKLTPSPLAGAP